MLTHRPRRLLACFGLLLVGRCVNILLPVAYKHVIDRLAESGAAAAAAAAARAGGRVPTLRAVCAELAGAAGPTFRAVFFPWVAAYLALAFLQVGGRARRCARPAAAAAGAAAHVRVGGDAGASAAACQPASLLARPPWPRRPPAGHQRQGRHRLPGERARPAVDPAAAGARARARRGRGLALGAGGRIAAWGGAGRPLGTCCRLGCLIAGLPWLVPATHAVDARLLARSAHAGA